MKRGLRWWLFLSLVLLAPTPALANWPMSPGPGLPIATGADEQVCLGICTDGSGGSIVLIRGPVMRAQRVDRLGRLVWAPDGVVLSPADPPATVWNSSIASDGEGGAFAAWVVSGPAFGFDTKLQVQRTRADGGLLALQATDVTGSETASFDSPGLVPDGSGGVVLAWISRSGTPGPSSTIGTVYVQRMDANGTPLWSAPRKVTESNLNQGGARYASDGAGGIVIAWTEPVGPASTVFAQRIDTNGEAQWGPNGITLSSSAYFGNVAVGEDGEGGFVVAWRSDQADIRAQRIDGAGIPSWTEGGVPVTNVATESATDVVGDNDGGVYVGLVRRGIASLDLFVQHLDADGVALWDPAGVCVGEERISSSGYLNRFGLQMATDGNRGTIVAWSEFGEPPFDNETDCRAQHFDSAGNRLWGSLGAVVSTAPDNQLYPYMIPDGNGGATLAWTQGPNLTGSTGTDVYGQHINRQGKLGTPAPPIASAAPISTRLSLQTVRPNPMSDRSSIHFSLERASRVRVSVLDMSGRRVRMLFEGNLEAGAHEVQFDASARDGTRLPAGLYFVSLEDGSLRQTRRIVVY